MISAGVDFETRSTVELKRTGVYPYARHHDTDVWCMAWAIADAEPALWVPGDPFPEELGEHIARGGEMRAWNAQFERVIWRLLCERRYGFPVVRREQWWCTMAESMAMALPRSLEHAAEVLHLAQQKDMKGNRLSKLMSRPRRFDDAGQPVWWDEPERLQYLYGYCQQDVRVEREAATKLRRLNARERRVYLLDQKINDRGVAFDRPMVVKAREIADREIARQNKIINEVTGGSVTTTTKVAKLKEWLATQGLDTPTLGKAALAALLDDAAEMPPNVAAALQARADSAKTSVKKLDAMLDCGDRDDRMRGLFIYHAASTGRWAGTLAQLHNMVRPSVAHDVIERDLLPRIAAGDPEGVVDMSDLSDALRSMIVAKPGHQLVAVDFSNIEARVLAWLAGESVMLEQFAEGRPIYKEMAGVIYSRKPEEIVKPSPEYQLGKNTVLGCGFGMGPAKFAAMNYGIEVELATKLVKMYRATTRAIQDDDRTIVQWEGVDPETWRQVATSVAAVEAYRNTYARVPLFWDNLNNAAIAAVSNPDAVYAVGKLKFVSRGGYMWVALPAGRALCYARPRIIEVPMLWDKSDVRQSVEYEGVDSYTRQWKAMRLYGGQLAENVVSGTARDLLVDAMFRTEDNGHEIVMTVHDELVAEVPEGVDWRAIEAEMCRVPGWAAGCPVGAEGWSGARYRK